MALLSARQLAGWVAYHAVEPWGERQAWWRASFLAATIINIFRGLFRKPPIHPKELMPPSILDARPRIDPRLVQSAEEQKAVMFAAYPKLKKQYEEREKKRARTS